MTIIIPYIDVIKKDKTTKKDPKKYNLYGSLCTINDILVKDVLLDNLDIGDVLVFRNVGAYSVTEGISLFLSRDLPKVVIVDKDKKIRLVRDNLKTSEINCPYYR